jgi:hypothetical protein
MTSVMIKIYFPMISLFSVLTGYMQQRKGVVVC